MPSVPSESAAPADGSKKSKVVYGKRKPTKSKPAAAAAREAPPVVADTLPTPPPPDTETKPGKEGVEPAPAEGGAAAEAADDWEDAVDDWDSADVTVSRRGVGVL